MVNLTRIYTRTGDDGTTSLGDMSRTGKNDPRLKAYADVDEANCAIGLTLAASEFPEGVRTLLVAIQNDLFDVGADLCTPVVENPEHPPLRVTDAYVERLEQACDDYNAQLDPLRSFVLPGGGWVSAFLHQARTVCRRAERLVTTLARQEAVGPHALVYLNRLSDLLFVLGRWAARARGESEPLWEPEKG